MNDHTYLLWNPAKIPSLRHHFLGIATCGCSLVQTLMRRTMFSSSGHTGYENLKVKCINQTLYDAHVITHPFPQMYQFPGGQHVQSTRPGARVPWCSMACYFYRKLAVNKPNVYAQSVLLLAAHVCKTSRIEYTFLTFLLTALCIPNRRQVCIDYLSIDSALADSPSDRS